MIYSHINKSKKEELHEHEKATCECAQKYFWVIEKMVFTIFSSMTENQRRFILHAAIDAIKMHDEGKKSPYFQFNKMGNKEFLSYKNQSTNHSIISSIIYLTKWINELNKLGKEYNTDIEWLIWYLAFAISRHHSGLIDFSLDKGGFVDAMRPYLEDETYFVNMDYSIDEIREAINVDNIFIKGNKCTLPKETFVFIRTVYSVLCYADFVATSIFMGNAQPEKESTPEILYKKYNSIPLVQNIKNGVYDSEINKIRNEIFNEAAKNFENQDKNFYYLSAPCGSGKTNILSNLIFTCMKSEKRENAVFVFPLNTLISQTKDIFGVYLDYGKDYIVKNSVSSIPFDDDESTNYEQMWINYQFLNYPLLITSHVKLFDILFGCSKADCMCLVRLFDSVVALDEIQQYKCSLWGNIITMLSMYSKLLNIKFIFSSATLPRWDYFIDEKNIFCDLLEKDYSKMEIFNDRVSYDYSLLQSKDIVNDLISYIAKYKDKKVLIEFINKKHAKDFYYIIKDKFDKVELITGDTNKKEKARILAESKKRNMILVSTQVIEAGCDVDFEIGFKDKSIIDSEIQFCGRIARNAKFKGIVYFFNMQNEKLIYRKDVRTDFTIADVEIRNFFENKEFNKLYGKIFERLKNEKSRNIGGSIEKFCSSLAFYKIQTEMQLIDSSTERVFLLSDDASEQILTDMKTLSQRKDVCYGERNIKMLRLNEQADDYTVNVPKNRLKEFDIIENVLGMLVARDRTNEVFL